MKVKGNGGGQKQTVILSYIWVYELLFCISFQIRGIKTRLSLTYCEVREDITFSRKLKLCNFVVAQNWGLNMLFSWPPSRKWAMKNLKVGWRLRCSLAFFLPALTPYINYSQMSASFCMAGLEVITRCLPLHMTFLTLNVNAVMKVKLRAAAAKSRFARATNYHPGGLNSIGRRASADHRLEQQQSKQ